MASDRFFRGVNLYLGLAGLLSGAMLFAPIAFASNYATGLHVTIYGTWIEFEQSLGQGVTAPWSLALTEAPLHIPYALMGAIGLLGALVLCFINRKGEAKLIWMGRFFILAFVCMLWAVLLRYMDSSYVVSEGALSSLDSGFQREFLLHLFILYFMWRAWSKQSKGLRDDTAGAAAAPTT